MWFDTHEKYKGNRGCDYEIKHQFTATKANYTRTFSGADAATLFLPYPTTLPTGMVAYELKRMKRANGESYFVFAPLPTSATLDANKPYVVRVTDGGSHNLPEMHNVVVPVTPALSATGVISPLDTDWMINGTTQFIPNATAAGRPTTSTWATHGYPSPRPTLTGISIRSVHSSQVPQERQLPRVSSWCLKRDL